MNLDAMFPPAEFASAELVEIAAAFTKPAVKKYLLHQQAQTFKAIANGLPKVGQSDAEYLRQQAQIVGALGVIEVLLGMENPSQQLSS